MKIFNQFEMINNSKTFKFTIGSSEKEFVQVGDIEEIEKNKLFRIMAQLVDGVDPKEIYVFLSQDAKMKNLTFVKKYT